MHLLSTILSPCCRIWNIYGSTEATVDSTYHIVDIASEENTVPIGLPLPNYQCLIKDHFFQDVIINQEGELFVGGVGIFAGYLGRNDLTEKALVNIDGEMFYRTGDLVRLDSKGLLHYIGRTDHQVKLHGQRIELGEIERCLLNIPAISGCVVMKWGDDHLLAYVQSSSVSEDELRSHCQSHLPPHMVPSFFIILDKLPLNANGKIDRKQLPSPSLASSTHPINLQHDRESRDAIEEEVRSIWCETLQRTDISSHSSFFSLGGYSLLFIRLYHQYITVFQLDKDNLSITKLMEKPTIFEHARLIRLLTTPIEVDTALWRCWSGESGERE